MAFSCDASLDASFILFYSRLLSTNASRHIRHHKTLLMVNIPYFIIFPLHSQMSELDVNYYLILFCFWILSLQKHWSETIKATLQVPTPQRKCWRTLNSVQYTSFSYCSSWPTQKSQMWIYSFWRITKEVQSKTTNFLKISVLELMCN